MTGWTQQLRSHKASKAVSLFELMVVFVVAAVLTAFFIYSAQYLMVSTRVSRVKEEHRVVKRALQNYEADTGTFPDTRSGLHALDGPIAYLVRIPADPFSESSEEYVYISHRGSQRWYLVSRGPDLKNDVLSAFGLKQRDGFMVLSPIGDLVTTLTLPVEQMEVLLTRLTYDPTNGLVSAGDIITTNH